MTNEVENKEDTILKMSNGFVVANKMPVRNHVRNCDIAIYNHMFSHEFCDLLIDCYEQGKSLRYDYDRQSTENNIHTTVKKDTTVNLIEPGEADLFIPKENDEHYKETNTTSYRIFCEGFNVALSYYIEDSHMCDETSRLLKVDGIKLQKTKPSEGYHVWHYEAAEHETMNRICFFILYLNDVAEGGETEFLKQSIRVVPEKGTLIIAPANYTAMHRGNPPLSNDKYILTGWVTI